MSPTVSPRNVLQLLEVQARRLPTHAALSWMTPEGMRTITWADYQQQVWAAASGLVDLGVQPGDTVAILAPNIVEHYVGDLAALLCGAATVSLYPTLVDEQLAHILADAQPSAIFAVDAPTADRLMRLLPEGSSTRVVTIGGPANRPAGTSQTWAELVERGAETLPDSREELAARLADRGDDDAAVYVYTSGTTGMPKGVVLSHANLLFQIDAFDRMGFFLGGYRTISYLPLAHIAERLWSLYFPLASGGNVLLCPDAGQLETCLRLLHPTFFMGVPRIWEKLRTTAERVLASEPDASRRAQAEADRATLAELWDRQQEEPLTSTDRIRAMKAREGVLAEIRRKLGLDWTVNPGVGAAALPEDLRDFWASLGVYLVNGYGLSETTGVAVWERVNGSSRGSSGFAIPGCDVMIAADGEILVRSPGNTAGYRNVDRAESGLFVDGWLATGDIGYLDDAGRLYVTDRKKEIIVNSAGKNISPTAIEDKFSGRSIINQVVAVGEGRPYIVALMTVNETVLWQFAERHDLVGGLANLLRHPRVLSEAQAAVDAGNERLSRPEQIKRFRLLPEQWSVDTGELTPTFKLRRKVISTRYASLVDSIYDNSSAGLTEPDTQSIETVTKGAT